MDYKHLNRALREHLDEIEEILDLFDKDTIHSIQLDLALSKTRDLYDVLLILKKLLNEDNSEEFKKKEERILKEIINKEDQQEEEEKQVIKEDQSGDKNISPEKEKKILSDRFKSKQDSIHDSLVKKSKNTSGIPEKIKAKPITNILTALGINEKFQIVNHLFGGNIDSFNETMQFVNNASDFNQAYRFLEENYNWDMDDELVQHLLDLIRRKFIVDKNG